jgi:alpha-galactosidase
MDALRSIGIAILVCLFLSGPANGDDVKSFLNWAPTPPMGWNSWDCYGTAVTEAQTKANADYMAEKLATHGWQYVVVDIQWYEPDAKGWEYRPGAKLEMDANGRLLPAVNRFPSAANDKGFKSLAHYVHARGLKFGVHIMRGIPRQAVAANSPILGTGVRAADIADKSSTCRWNPDMYGVDVSKPGGQEYYDSIFAQFAEWGIDFVKVDDLSRPYHQAEIAAIRRAIDKCGRPIVFSTSPGATPLDQAADIAAHANMWRISDDFWDKWSLLKEQFQLCAAWAPFGGDGHYPDADMLPLGVIRTSKDSRTHFTKDEQYTLMSLWSICRSPLIFGGDLPQTDAFTLSLLTNDEVLAVNQHSSGGRQLFRHDDLVAWTAQTDNSKDKYLAVFNARDEGHATISVAWKDLGFDGPCKVRDLWAGNDLGVFSQEFEPVIAPHGAGLYRVSLER